MNNPLRTKITICLLTYNRCEDLKRLLLFLKRISYNPLEIIVVDNHSIDDTINMVNDEFPTIKYLRTHKNIGVVARNLGLKNASGEIIITLDDDIVGITDNDIINIIDFFFKKPNLGALNFKVIDYYSGSICNWIHHYNSQDYSEKEFLTYEITEGAVAFRKTILEKVGYYTDYFFLSHEGPDLAMRILNNGYDVMYSDIVTVKHSHSNLGRKSWYKYYYDTRNQLWLAVRNFPLSYAITYLTRGLLSMMVYSIRDGYFFYWIKAILDGLKKVKVVLKDRDVLDLRTMEMIKSIDKGRPNIWYLIKTRILKTGIRG